MKKNVVYLLFTYPVGLCIGLAFWLLKILGVLKVKGWENFPHWQERVLVVSNHPSLLEPALLIGLFARQYAVRPLRYGPYTLADKKNYCQKWWSWIVMPRLIAVDRTNEQRESFGSLVVARNVLKAGGSIILFPEGGRTFKGTRFVVSESGKKIRQLKAGFALLTTVPGTLVVPVWVERNNRNMGITIGIPMTFDNQPKEEIVQKIQSVLLSLADLAR